LAKEGMQLWEIPMQFHQLAGRLVKPANYDGMQFLKYDDLFKVRRDVLLVWMKHLEA
jgi:hypothetical protein